MSPPPMYGTGKVRAPAESEEDMKQLIADCCGWLTWKPRVQNKVATKLGTRGARKGRERVASRSRANSTIQGARTAVAAGYAQTD
eukprot:gene11120-biopygen7785